MRLRFTVISVVLFVSGCQSYSDDPARSITVAGNYVALADCSYLAVEKEGAWRREELPSKNNVRLLRGDDKYAIAKVDFDGISPTETRITMRFMTPIQGPNYYPDRMQKVVENCAVKS